MTILLSIVTQLLHMAVVMCAAPLLTGVVAALTDRLAGRAPPPVARPWRQVVHLFRKQTIRIEGASPVTRLAPLLSVAVAALNLVLIPSFALGMVSAPLSDMLTIVALFAFGRVVPILAAMDAGTGVGGVAATEAASLAIVAKPALLLAAFALALQAGGGNLDTVLVARMDGLLPPNPAAALAIAALALVGWADREGPSMDASFSGADLALLRIAEQLRLLAWCDLIGALALPFGMAAADAGPVSWGTGLLAWAGRLLLAALVLAAVRAAGKFGPTRTVLVLALALCGIAVVLGLSGGDPT
jgi:formate hydrogenlyase subunit 4